MKYGRVLSNNAFDKNGVVEELIFTTFQRHHINKNEHESDVYCTNSDQSDIIEKLRSRASQRIPDLRISSSS